MATVTKEQFFVQAIGEGKSWKEAEKAWKESGFSIKRGKSAKATIASAFIAGEVSSENIDEWIQENGTPNDITQVSYYRGLVEDFEAIYKAGQDSARLDKKAAKE